MFRGILVKSNFFNSKLKGIQNIYIYACRYYFYGKYCFVTFLMINAVKIYVTFKKIRIPIKEDTVICLASKSLFIVCCCFHLRGYIMVHYCQSKKSVLPPGWIIKIFAQFHTQVKLEITKT